MTEQLRAEARKLADMPRGIEHNPKTWDDFRDQLARVLDQAVLSGEYFAVFEMRPKLRYILALELARFELGIKTENIPNYVETIDHD